jgi:ribonuclease E
VFTSTTVALEEAEPAAADQNGPAKNGTTRRRRSSRSRAKQGDAGDTGTGEAAEAAELVTTGN